MPKPPKVPRQINHGLLFPGIILIVLTISVWFADPPRAGQNPLLLALGILLSVLAFVQPQRQVQQLDLRLFAFIGVLLMVVSSTVYALNLHSTEALVALPFALGMSLTVAALIMFLRGDS